MEEYLASCVTMMNKVKKPLAMMSFKYMSTKKKCKTLHWLIQLRLDNQFFFNGIIVTCEILKIKERHMVLN
jgi:hypothetical protein